MEQKQSTGLDQQEEQKQLWELNDVVISGNYKRQEYDDGNTYFTLATARNDLPPGFWLHERDKAVELREEAERLAESSGKWAQDARQAGGSNNPDYQLPSQQIANNPNMGLLSSSANAAKDARKKKKKGWKK